MAWSELQDEECLTEVGKYLKCLHVISKAGTVVEVEIDNVIPEEKFITGSIWFYSSIYIDFGHTLNLILRHWNVSLLANVVEHHTDICNLACLFWTQMHFPMKNTKLLFQLFNGPLHNTPCSLVESGRKESTKYRTVWIPERQVLLVTPVVP